MKVALKKRIIMMRRNYKLSLLVLLLAFASCSFTTKKFQDPNKDKLLIQLITYVLDKGHFSPQDINDDFSKEVFTDYLEQLDPFKRYFYASDISEFETYETALDDQIKAYDVTFFNITHERLLKRIEESKDVYKDVLSKRFDFSMKEDFSTDYKKLDYVSSKKEMKERWRQQLKFSTIANYDDLLSEQEFAKTNALKANDLTAIEFEKLKKERADLLKKSKKELEQEARVMTGKSLDELYDFIDDRKRKDWFAVYINAIVEEFDPHTFYFAPEDKDRFDVAMSGKLEGIGARLQKKMDATMVNEIISGGPAWRQKGLEVGDQIMKVRQEDEDESVSIVGMPLNEAIKFIKGPKGTEVTLTLKKVDGTIKVITIVRYCGVGRNICQIINCN